ncbi:hypothetical protein MASR1M45_12990 [Candidatus Kapaibacterium sp.]
MNIKFRIKSLFHISLAVHEIPATGGPMVSINAEITNKETTIFHHKGFGFVRLGYTENKVARIIAPNIIMYFIKYVSK